MKKYMGLGIKSDDELLSLSCNGALFINLDAGSGPLRSGMKDRMMLKEMEASRGAEPNFRPLKNLIVPTLSHAVAHPGLFSQKISLN